MEHHVTTYGVALKMLRISIDSLPDVIALCQETSFTFALFRENYKDVGIKLEFSEIEVYSSIEKGEIYHYSFRRIFDVVKEEQNHL